MLTRKKIIFTTFFTAIAVRALFAVSFANSFFASYHLVPGLDMETLLRFSQWQPGGEIPPFFTFHRLWLFLVWLINGKTHCVWATFILQTLLGAAGIAALTDSVLKLSRCRKAALVTGIAAGIYLPLMVYEFSILQETFMVNFALIFFWASLNILHKRFSLSAGIIFAVSAFAALAGRPAAVIFAAVMLICCAYHAHKRKMLKKFIPSVALLFFLLGGAAFFNYLSFGAPTPFYMVLDYTVEYNTSVTPGAEKSSELDGLLLSAKNAFTRLPKLIKTGELPENQNIYFWCEKIPSFHFLLSPGLLIPCAAAGIMIILLTGRWKTRYGLLLIPILTMALPLCAREVIGRYRLMLVPYFFMAAACGAVIYLRLKAPKQRALALCGAGFGALFAIWHGDVPEKIRLADCGAYAIAAARTPGAAPEKVINEHLLYWEMSRFRSPVAFNMLMDQLLRFRKTAELRAVAVQALNSSAIDPDEVYYFAAWSYALENQPQKVWENLVKIKKLSPEKQQNAIMLLNDTKKMLNNMQK